jgi:hypothetical protein
MRTKIEDSNCYIYMYNEMRVPVLRISMKLKDIMA